MGSSLQSPLAVIFELAVLMLSVMIHEISHGVTALALGDHTAKRAGRLTFNPLKHLDLVGSILLPLMLFLLGGPVFGWAKPVPVNIFHLKNPRAGAGLIGAAGPVSNFAVAVVFALLTRVFVLWLDNPLIAVLLALFQFIIITNIALAVFNLLPIPPLDGSNILFSLLPRSYFPIQAFLTRYGFYILLALIFFGGLGFIGSVIEAIYGFLVGEIGYIL